MPVEEKTPEKRPSLLDPFRQRIKDMVEEGMMSTRIFRRIGPEESLAPSMDGVWGRAASVPLNAGDIFAMLEEDMKPPSEE